MKKALFIMLAMLPLVFIGCSNNEELENYTTKQEKAFVLFKGTWADIQFSNLSGGHLSELKQDPDKIVFGIHHSKPIEVYKDDYINGKELLFKNQGECTYYNMPYKDGEYEVIECYYEITMDADYLRLFRKSDNTLYQRYDMSIKSETRIELHDTRVSLPYIFVKQGDEEPENIITLIGVFLTKGEWKNGETMNMYVYPPNQGNLPQQYSYIKNVEYFVNGQSIGKSSVSPFSISYTPNLSLGQHSLSLKLDLNKENIVWETLTTTFTIIE